MKKQCKKGFHGSLILGETMGTSQGLQRDPVGPFQMETKIWIQTRAVIYQMNSGLISTQSTRVRSNLKPGLTSSMQVLAI